MSKSDHIDFVIAEISRLARLSFEEVVGDLGEGGSQGYHFSRNLQDKVKDEYKYLLRGK
jgi:hypothetical protein